MLIAPALYKNIVEPVRLGLLLNARAREAEALQRSAEAILGAERSLCTERVDEVPAALHHLLHDEQITVLGICGGDGTLHHGINELIAYWRQERQRRGRPVALPAILPLRGGTMNMLARAIRIEGSPSAILRRFLRRHQRGWVADLPLVDLRLLQVDLSPPLPSPRNSGDKESFSPQGSAISQGQGSATLPFSPALTRFGFIFGSDLTARCLEIYEERFGGGYWGMARLLQEAVTGYLFRTSLWREYQHLLTTPRPPLQVDGHSAPYLAAVASTVDIKLLAGLIRGLLVGPNDEEGCFRLRLLQATNPRQVIQSLPRLVLGKSGPGIIDFQQTTQLLLQGDFSLDGEVYTAHKGTVHLHAPSLRLRFVSPFP